MVPPPTGKDFQTPCQRGLIIVVTHKPLYKPDMEKGADTRTLSAEIFENCGNFLIVEDYAPLFSEENLFLVEMFDETFNIWDIYSL